MSTDQQTDIGNEFVDFWNEILVPNFIKFKHILVGGLSHHSEKVFPPLDVKEGDTVTDVGGGFGDTAMLLAQRVGPEGSVLAIDCCDAFLEFGRKDAKAAGIDNITFVEADVQTYPFEPVHDFCFSRFGTQFFENPVAGLKNMRASLKPGGVIRCKIADELSRGLWHHCNFVMQCMAAGLKPWDMIMKLRHLSVINPEQKRHRARRRHCFWICVKKPANFVKIKKPVEVDPNTSLDRWLVEEAQ